MRVDVIIPAYNEEASIAKVIRDIPAGSADRIVVVDNGSDDNTAAEAAKAGAEVTREPARGYGRACLRGIAACPGADILVFLDADYSDEPSELPELIRPILEDRADLVIGSRIAGNREPGALPPHARFGNQLACFLIRRLFGYRFTDLGPFRAVTRTALESLEMRDPTYGWTVEMQAKAAMRGLRCAEIPVSYKKRIGRSKISGTAAGSVKAGAKILTAIFTLWLQHRFGRTRSPSAPSARRPRD